LNVDKLVNLLLRKGPWMVWYLLESSPLHPFSIFSHPLKPAPPISLRIHRWGLTVSSVVKID
jgi:hypothetical protein